MAQHRTWAIAMATAGLLALPIIGAAQSYPSSQSGQTTTSGQSTTGQSTYSSTDQNSPIYHLDKAKKDLDDISTSSLTGDAATQISSLKTHFDELYNTYKNKSGQSPSGSSSSNYGLGNSQSGSTAAMGGSSSTGGQVGTTGTEQSSGV